MRTGNVEVSESRHDALAVDAMMGTMYQGYVGIACFCDGGAAGGACN